jgi:2-C-methyl-D-erythritol 4-phosphate cytidylyltransferase
VQTKATVKQGRADGFVEKTLDRSVLWEMHTPQVIRPQILRDGFALVARTGLAVTDDVSIVEAMGLPVKITKGEYTNLKVTTPEDMFIAERLLDEALGVLAAA